MSSAKLKPADVTKPSTPAERALAEAEARRREHAARDTAMPKELGNRKGPEPTRYGDWEKGGIASDF
jgi:hypothetical protein